MQYFSNKPILTKHIVEILKSFRKEQQLFVELYINNADVVSQMDGERYAFCESIELEQMYEKLQNGWIPPTYVSEEGFNFLKSSNDGHMKGYVGHSWSSSGKYFEKYIDRRRFGNQINVVKSLLKKIETMKDVKLYSGDYMNVYLTDALIYSSPPNKGFTDDMFWDNMRKLSQTNDVIVREYSAPSDFECIWERNCSIPCLDFDNVMRMRVDKLFKLKTEQ